MKKVLILGANALCAAALASTLVNSGPAVMPTRRAELEPDYDMNDLIDLDGKAGRKADRKARLKAAQAKAFSGEKP